MMDIVFSDSEKGLFRYAQRCGHSVGGASAIGIIGQAGEDLTQDENDSLLAEAIRQQEQRLCAEKPLGGNAQDVIGLSFALDIGDIASPVTAAGRRDLLREMLGANPWGELPDLEASIDAHWQNCVSDLEKLLSRAQAGESARIWYSDAPYATCGLYHVIHLLQGCECDITVVKLPGYLPLGDQGARSAVSWAEVCPGELADYLPSAVAMPKCVRQAISAEWQGLMRQNARLRVVVNGRLQSAAADFYDSFIRRQVPDGHFKVAQLIGHVLGQCQLGVGDWLIADRIKQMIKSGELLMVEQATAFYGTTLKRA